MGDLKEKLAIFREYDIRGIYGEDLIKENVVRIGYLIGKELQKRGGKTLGVGYDARVHSLEIFKWFCDGVFASGAVAYNLGAIPTPVGYFALYATFKDFNGENPASLDGNVMITGSHNPPKYNGFKITLLKEPFFGEAIYALERDFYALNYDSIAQKIPQNAQIKALDVLSLYVDYLTNAFKHLEGFRIPLSIDCGNGIAGVGITKILDNLKISYDGLFLNPDGTFPNHHPDPSEEKNLTFLKDKLSKNGGIGFAFDGDGDRLSVLKRTKEGIKIYKGDELAMNYCLFLFSYPDGAKCNKQTYLTCFT